MPDPMPAQIIEAQFALAEILLPIFVGGAIAVLLVTLGCLWELCRQSRHQEDRRI